MSQNIRKPKAAKNIADNKSVRVKTNFINNKGPRVICKNSNRNGRKPTWRFQLIDMESPFFNVRRYKRGGRIYVIYEEILRKLKSFESMTWQEIDQQSRGNGHSSNHFIPVEDLSKEAKRRLNELQQDDIDQVYSISIGGKRRLIGIFDGVGSSFDVIWYDPDHKVCPSRKKHT